MEQDFPAFGQLDIDENQAACPMKSSYSRATSNKARFPRGVLHFERPSRADWPQDSRESPIKI